MGGRAKEINTQKLRKAVIDLFYFIENHQSCNPISLEWNISGWKLLSKEYDVGPISVLDDFKK